MVGTVGWDKIRRRTPPGPKSQFGPNLSDILCKAPQIAQNRCNLALGSRGKRFGVFSTGYLTDLGQIEILVGGGVRLRILFQPTVPS